MSKKYRLLKDLPDADAGTLLFLQDNVYYYKTRTESDAYYTPCAVENNPTWFQRVDEKIYTQDDIDEARRRAFKAARQLEFGDVITGYMGEGLRYKMLADYLITINDNKK